MLFSKGYLFGFKELVLHAKKMKVGSRRETSASSKVMRNLLHISNLSPVLLAKNQLLFF